LKRFEHGGDIYSFSKALKLKPKDIIDFSSNINYLHPKVKIKNINIAPYPDKNYTHLKQIFAKKYNITQKNITFFSGGSEAIFEFIKNSPKDKVTLYAPIYLEYERAAKIYKKEIFFINRFKNIYKKPIKNSLVIFVNPSTPDGKYYNIKKLLKIWKKRECQVLIDESFLDFSDKNSAISFLKEYKNITILKSLTKIYSSAGVRVGVLISNKKCIKKLESTKPLWLISKYDEEYVKQALLKKSFVKKTQKSLKKNRDFLKRVLIKSSYFSKVYNSNANFLLAKLKKITSSKLQQKLKDSHILIRDCSNFTFLNKKYVRFAVKSKKDIKKLKNALIS
jgi:threonine-phosphate decarboxylase